MTYKVFASKEYERGRARLKRRGFDLALLDAVVDMLALGGRLPPQYKDHALKGDALKRRECHVDGKPKGDWLLVYRKVDEALLLYLVETGTHAEIFGR